MKTFLLFLFLLLSCLHGYGQHIKVAPGGGRVTITYDTGGYHKYLYILRGPDSTCGDIIGYDPDVHTGAGNDNKYTALSFKGESGVISKLLQVAADYRPHMLCTCMISVLSYDDLLLRQINAFEHSKEWQAYIAKYKSGPYDMQLMTDIITDRKVLQPLDSLLQRSGYRIASIYVPDEVKEAIPQSVLKRLKKDKTLIIPQIDPIWIQLMRK
jgi:hypothetical protein